MPRSLKIDGRLDGQYKLEQRIEDVESRTLNIEVVIKEIKITQESHHSLDDARFKALSNGQDMVSSQLSSMGSKFDTLGKQVDLLESVRDTFAGGVAVTKYLGWAGICGIAVYIFKALTGLKP